MAKKGQVIQLQTDVNNDEDWEKLLQRDGLIVVDVYSEWCGPCSGMTATLKKLKLEIGGDLLQLAIAKSDKITALERFRNKSEPTWMFLVNGKMVNFMFGANAPKLTRLITDELKKEAEARDGRRERTLYNIDELTEEEKERQAILETQLSAAREKELAKAAKDLHDRRLVECNNILETLNHFGVILIFHHARNGYQEAFGDLLGEAGLTINQTEKIDIITRETLGELFFFTGNIPFPEESIEELANEQSLALLIKQMPARDVEEPTDDLILQIVYGPSRKPPGGHDSPAQILSHIKQESEEGEPLEPLERIGLWVPLDQLEKATALRLFFPKVTEHYLIPEPEPTPPHYAVVFDALRRSEILELMEKYADDVLRFGFFTSEKPENAKLIAKNLKKYEKQLIKMPIPDAKMVIQLSRKRSECVLAFVQMKPQYMSANAKEGERECKIFFPDDYNEPPVVEEEEPQKPKKKKKKSASADQEGFEGTGAEDEYEVEDEEPDASGMDQRKTKRESSESQIIPPSQRSSMVTPSLRGSTTFGEPPHTDDSQSSMITHPPTLPPTRPPSTPSVSEKAPLEDSAGAPIENASPPESPPAESVPTSEPTSEVTETTDEESPA